MNSDELELRRVEQGEGKRDEYVLASEWNRDGTPVEHSTEWRGYKGDFFDLFYEVNELAYREFPDLLSEVSDT